MTIRSGESVPTTANVLKRLLTQSDRLSVSIDDELMVEEVGVRDLVARFGSPLFVLSDSTLRANYGRIRAAFEAAWPGSVNVMYAIKCNPNFAVRAVLHQEGAGGDCFGTGELEATFAGGADRDTIALNGSNKTAEALRRAVELGVYINLDDEEEIDRLAAIARDAGTRVRVNIRLKIVPESYSDYESDLIGFRGDIRPELRRWKWGVTADVAERMIGRIGDQGELELTGYHAHLGRMSPVLDYRAAFDAEVGSTATALYRATGFAPAVIDIGGGWARERDPESKRETPNPYRIEDYAAASAEALLAPLLDAGMPVPALWLEPGRYIAGNAGVLVATVGAVKRDAGMTWVNVDASTNLMPLIGAGDEGTRNMVIAATGMDRPLTLTADVVGPICIPSVLGQDCALPEVAHGDLIAILDAGMYAESDSHQLNCVPRPATVMVRGAKAAVIRAAETLDGLFANQRIPAWLQGTEAPPSHYRDQAVSAADDTS